MLGEYTTEERAEMLARMRNASHLFYRMAAVAGCHTFLEFCGLMNEFIRRCELADAAGDASWVHANGHDVNLPLDAGQIAYIREKLGCIYGDAVLARA